jgi:RNA-dependent RNA polymerase
MKLAALCSKAVDYAKNGKPVDLHNLPRSLTRLKPDWHKTEVTADTHDPDYYESDRALGHLFRAIDLRKPYEHPKGIPTTSPKDVVPLEDPITRALAPLVRYMICQGDRLFGSVNAQAQGLHARYVREMRYICMTHTLIDSPDICLNEEEVVLGTILANCTQPRWHSDRTQRMRLHSEMLVRDMRSHIMPDEGPPAEPQLREGLRSGWAMWSWARHHRDEEFIDSFSLITLGVIFDCLGRLGALQDI